MQSLVPDVLDLGRETAATQKLYGIDSAGAIAAAVRHRSACGPGGWSSRACASSRSPARPAHRNGTWDQHGNLKKGHEKNALDTDQAIAGLIKDLKARGLLDETLIVWAGEFGRTPHSAGRDGRDHHPEGFTVWLAGGGVKGGIVYGATDELGMHAVENVVHDARPARHDPAPARPRSRAADLPLQRPRLPPDRCAWARGAARFWREDPSCQCSSLITGYRLEPDSTISTA